jgi:hypothetical protein
METKQYQIIKKVLVLLPFYLFTFLPLNAQTFTQRIQQQKAGQGTVTIHESTEIDQLVNESKLGPVTSPTSTTKPATTKPTTTKPSNTTTNDPSKASSQSAQEETSEEGAAEPTKKIMTGGYKINGYRVQAFAGGNSRKDRQQAESVGNQIKSSYPGVPVYVHFYSPRWICRVGNYRTYEEAHQMLLSLRKMGFSEAVVVKGKITVYD